ncbi:ArsR/SmtB family transcription factor [Streptosporangium jomthongense]|uniref:ArsR/SmtB family transcription factor n=1 Tax=Streptosporangium jomthongense TaxID=1193683 RepID=A0ABV8F2R8_9ACTN
MEHPRRDPDIARAARLIASASRAHMLKALSGGRPLAASVLAEEAGVTPATASVHLRRLTEAGLVVGEQRGRHHYYRLASAEVSTALEALAVIAPTVPAPVASLRVSSRENALRRSRTCYDHLAGSLGVGLMETFVSQGLLTGTPKAEEDGRGPDLPAAYGRALEYHLTGKGGEVFGRFGVDVARLSTRRRPVVRYCVDWSERRHHLAGGLGAALTGRFFTLDWLRYGVSPRVVHLTETGRRGLADTFSFEAPA